MGLQVRATSTGMSDSTPALGCLGSQLQMRASAKLKSAMGGTGCGALLLLLPAALEVLPQLRISMRRWRMVEGCPKNQKQKTTWNPNCGTRVEWERNKSRMNTGWGYGRPEQSNRPVLLVRVGAPPADQRVSGGVFSPTLQLTTTTTLGQPAPTEGGGEKSRRLQSVLETPMGLSLSARGSEGEHTRRLVSERAPAGH